VESSLAIGHRGRPRRVDAEVGGACALVRRNALLLRRLVVLVVLLLVHLPVHVTRSGRRVTRLRSCHIGVGGELLFRNVY
jgi:hypothetical protein